MFGGFDHRKTTAYCLTYGIWGFALICFVIGAKDADFDIVLTVGVCNHLFCHRCKSAEHRKRVLLLVCTHLFS